jgi:hypothetical protein
MPRREFSKAVKRAANRRAHGLCECHRVPQLGRPKGCGRPLGPGNRFHEHIHPDGAGGPPTLDNCAVLVKTCWHEKTGGYDQPLVAKVRRQRDRNMSIGRGNNRRPMDGSRNS